MVQQGILIVLFALQAAYTNQLGSKQRIIFKKIIKLFYSKEHTNRFTHHCRQSDILVNMKKHYPLEKSNFVFNCCKHPFIMKTNGFHQWTVPILLVYEYNSSFYSLSRKLEKAGVNPILIEDMVYNFEINHTIKVLKLDQKFIQFQLLAKTKDERIDDHGKQQHIQDVLYGSNKCQNFNKEQDDKNYFQINWLLSELTIQSENLPKDINNVLIGYSYVYLLIHTLNDYRHWIKYPEEALGYNNYNFFVFTCYIIMKSVTIFHLMRFVFYTIQILQTKINLLTNVLNLFDGYPCKCCDQKDTEEDTNDKEEKWNWKPITCACVITFTILILYHVYYKWKEPDSAVYKFLSVNKVVCDIQMLILGLFIIYFVAVLTKKRKNRKYLINREDIFTLKAYGDLIQIVFQIANFELSVIMSFLSFVTLSLVIYTLGSLAKAKTYSYKDFLLQLELMSSVYLVIAILIIIVHFAYINSFYEQFRVKIILCQQKIQHLKTHAKYYYIQYEHRHNEFNDPHLKSFLDIMIIQTGSSNDQQDDEEQKQQKKVQNQKLIKGKMKNKLTDFNSKNSKYKLQQQLVKKIDDQIKPGNLIKAKIYEEKDEEKISVNIKQQNIAIILKSFDDQIEQIRKSCTEQIQRSKTQIAQIQNLKSCYIQNYAKQALDRNTRYRFQEKIALNYQDQVESIEATSPIQKSLDPPNNAKYVKQRTQDKEQQHKVEECEDIQQKTLNKEQKQVLEEKQAHLQELSEILSTQIENLQFEEENHQFQLFGFIPLTFPVLQGIITPLGIYAAQYIIQIYVEEKIPEDQ